MGDKVPQFLHEKKTHHYVWVHYFKKWRIDPHIENKKIVNVWCRTQSNNVAIINVRSILSEEYFYKIRPLKAEHLELIKYFFHDADDGLKKSVLEFIKFSRFISRVRSLDIKPSNDLEKALSLGEANTLENLHTKREDGVRQILDSLANEELSILDDQQNMLNFIDFFSHQIMRTKTMKNRVLASFNRKNEKIGILLDECWWLFSNSLGNNIGASLYCRRNKDNHCLLINDTDEPFITSDTPVINVFSGLETSNCKALSDDECDLYYPISPRIAYMISCSHRFPKGTFKVSIEIVNELNEKMAKNSAVYLISNEKEMVNKYKKYVGKSIFTE